MKNRELMSSGNPFKAVLVFSIPSIIAMLVNAIYNIIDKIFVGNFVSSDALGGLQVVNPLTFLSFALMVMFGLGSSSYSSNKLGEKKDKEANDIFNNSLVVGIIVILIMSILFFIFRNGLIKVSGGNSFTTSYAKEYLNVLIFGFIFQFISYFFTMNMRSEGKPFISMLAQVTGCIVNIILDALFIVVFKWGVFGAAFATVLGHIANFSVGIYYYIFSKKHFFYIDFKNLFKINFNHIYQVVSIGLSSAILNVCNAISTFVYNNIISKYTDALSILAILNSLDSICILPCVGIRQGLLPLFGYNYGEKNNKRIFKLYWAGMIYGISYGLIICLLIKAFPFFFANLFVDGNDLSIINEAARILGFYQLGIIIISFNMNTSALYQASRAKIKASILSAMRQFIFLVPLLLIFDNTLGQNGIWYAMPISDALSALTAFILFLITYFYFKKTGFLSFIDKRKSEVNL